MTVMLNLPRQIDVPFSGAGIMAHPVLKQYNGTVLKLHAGLNVVIDEVAQHPLLRMFVADERVAAPIVPLVPLAGPGAVAGVPAVPPGYVYDPVRAGMPSMDPMRPGQPMVYEPQPEPMNPTAAMLSHANEPEADQRALERARDAAKAEFDRLDALAKERAKENGVPLQPVDAAQRVREEEIRTRSALAGAAPGTTVPPRNDPAVEGVNDEARRAAQAAQAAQAGSAGSNQPAAAPAPPTPGARR